MIRTTARATLDDLMRVEGKAELIGGRIVQFMASGYLLTGVAEAIFVRLRSYAKSHLPGVAKADGIGYAVPELASGRESFSPDASYYDGPMPANRMWFIEGPPTFAVEVRSENDYGNAAEIDMAAKRNDYFEAGTLIVWDVDPLARVIRVYLKSDPTTCHTLVDGDIAHAEPAVPGWWIAVTDIFDDA